MSTTPPDPPTAITPSTPPDPAPGESAALKQRLTELEAELAKARDSLTQSQRRRDVDRLLLESGATDLEAAAALVMEQLGAAERPDITDEVRALKRRKPALFRRSTSTSSMGGRESDHPESPVDSALRDARSGGRAALLRYMRARRG